MGFFLSVATTTAARFKILNLACLYTVGLLFWIVGVGYAIGGSVVGGAHGYDLLTRWEPGGMHTHGGIMLGIGSLILLFDPREGASGLTRIGLILGGFYASWTAFLVIGEWFVGPLAWGGPWFYLALGVLCITLAIVSTTPLARTRRGRRSA